MLILFQGAKGAVVQPFITSQDPRQTCRLVAHTLKLHRDPLNGAVDFEDPFAVPFTGPDL